MKVGHDVHSFKEGTNIGVLEKKKIFKMLYSYNSYVCWFGLFILDHIGKFKSENLGT